MTALYGTNNSSYVEPKGWNVHITSSHKQGTPNRDRSVVNIMDMDVSEKNLTEDFKHIEINQKRQKKRKQPTRKNEEETEAILPPQI